MRDDSYKTISAPIVHEIKEKGSRFICRARGVRHREDVEAFIEEISRQHYDATHNCFAYRVLFGQEELTRFSDDGEPSGTAGKPILQAILSYELTNVIVIVTRYFGGVKLGTGGLVRAYGGVATETLSRAKIETVYLWDTMTLSCSYHQVNTIKGLIEKFSGQVVESDYGESIQMTVQIRKKFSASFIQSAVDLTSGQVEPHRI